MALARIQRVYFIPTDLLQAFEKLPVSRSGSIGIAIHEAYHDPDRLGRTLSKRLKSNEVTSPEKVKTGVSLAPEIVAMLDELAEKSQFSIEQVLRLCMEGYILKL